jgi:tripartite-type tricarboxylate transporter receptor subunit TctC
MVAGVGTGASLTPQIKAGKVRVLAICEGHERIESLPDVPTLYELGFKDAAPPLLNIIFGPKGLPESIVKKIADAFLKGSQTDGFKKVCKETDTFPWTKNNIGQALREHLETTYKNNGILVKKLGLTKPK